MKIQLQKPASKIIGALRVSPETFDKIEKLAKKEKVTNQDIIRAILEQVIDEVEI